MADMLFLSPILMDEPYNHVSSAEHSSVGFSNGDLSLMDFRVTRDLCTFLDSGGSHEEVSTEPVKAKVQR